MADSSTPWWEMFLPFSTSEAASAVDSFQGGIGQWLTNLGGELASGIEGAVVAVLGDVWDVIAGPIEVIIGLVIAFIVLGWAFKNQLIQLGSIAAMAAA